ncbi:MAG TPA: L-2-amino-thiazoline-4-carboxylic acid hydrolase [Smithella sp.]|nr:L-2-amino-thiazoline-4-carboxylic acid hydrolase [Smithella sp.]
MIKIFSWSVVFIFTLPFVLQTYALRAFLGEKRAIRIVGRQLTLAGALVAKLIVPRINSKQDFEVFREKIKRNFLFFDKFLCLRIENETQDKIEFRFQFCPVTKMLKIFGLPGICKYSCAGDWMLAKQNKEYWTFTRKQTIGTGGSYCDHTYSRKQ